MFFIHFQDLQKFMDNAKDGFIYFSFGSIIPAHKIPKYVLNAFIKLFSSIKQKVIWKVELNNTNELLLENQKNILIQKWVPQKKLLGKIITFTLRVANLYIVILFSS